MFFDKLFSTRSLENPAVPLSAESAYEDLFGAQPTKVVSPDLAMKLAAVYACVYVLSSSLAQLPLHVKRKQGEKVETVRDHPASTYCMIALISGKHLTNYVNMRKVLSCYTVMLTFTLFVIRTV